MKPEEIYAESFRIIEAEVGEHGFAPPEWRVVRRMIHASGDIELARSVRFGHDAVASGIRALREGRPIVTDVTMIAAGLKREQLRRLNVSVACFINDDEVRELAYSRGETRSYWAMDKACRELPEAIYVIGNAPTALFALCSAVQVGRCRPRLVLAMPVGFVSVVESKAEALTLDVPLITIPGRKGGSAVAAAALNALAELALERGPA